MAEYRYADVEPEEVKKQNNILEEVNEEEKVAPTMIALSYHIKKEWLEREFPKWSSKKLHQLFASYLEAQRRGTTVSSVVKMAGQSRNAGREFESTEAEDEEILGDE